MFKEYHGTFRNKQCEIMQLNEDCQCDKDLSADDVCTCMDSYVTSQAHIEGLYCPTCLAHDECEHTTIADRDELHQALHHGAL